MNQDVNGPPLKRTIKAIVSIAAIIAAYFKPKSKRAANMGISQNWNHLPKAKEGMANPERVGCKLNEIAAKTIINEISFEFTNFP